ncbi:hypothetical protein P692DRAFT_201914743, partial [Suillus brevipes Sb2]
MQLLDSRASQKSPNQALLTLHADYMVVSMRTTVNGILRPNSTSTTPCATFKIMVFSASTAGQAPAPLMRIARNRYGTLAPGHQKH